MTHDISSLATELLERCRALGLQLTTAESCTGGMISAALTDVAGSSDVFERGFVTYSNAAKSELLGVPLEVIDMHGAVSDEVACRMADGAVAAARAELSIAVTGVAGPGASETKPEGLVWIAIAQTGQNTRSDKQEFGVIGRSNVRLATVKRALELALEFTEPSHSD